MEWSRMRITNGVELDDREIDISFSRAGGPGGQKVNKTSSAVVLRFHPRVAQRVQETRWHTSQQVEEQKGGYLIWRAQVAEPQEMLPWIRGWGADCEVLKPDGLRETLMGETCRLVELYGNIESTVQHRR